MLQQGSIKNTSPNSGGGVFCCIPSRYVMVVLTFIGITLQFSLKVFLSVAIVAMVKTEHKNTTNSWLLNNTADNQDVCPEDKAETSSSDDQEGEFYWSQDIQGYVLSSYYYGYAATQLLGGRLSEIYGSKVVAGPGVFIAGLVTVLCPLAARIDVGVLIAARVLVGAASGVIISSSTYLLTKWFLPEEINLCGGIMLSGCHIGTVLSMSLSGIIVEAGSWPLSFYIFGGAAISFIIPWMFLVYDTPDKHPRISEAEKKHIPSGTGNKNKKSYPVPWFDILTSWPLWVHIINGVGHGWVSYTLLSDMPTYLSHILHFELKQSGLISALPYATAGIASILSSWTSNWLRQKGYISHLTAYRIFNAISSYGSSLCLILITFSGCNSTIIVILLVCAVGTASFTQGGSILNHVDLGNNFAGTTAGIFLTAVTMMGIFSPSVTGLIINEQETLNQWRIVFYLGAGIASLFCTVYMIFGQVEEQYWNKLPSETDQNSQETKQYMKAV